MFLAKVVDVDIEQNCSLEDSGTLTTLGRTLRLVIAVDDLASTNKPFRADWDARRATVLGLVRDLVTVNTSK